jgi:hypothetical protein
MLMPVSFGYHFDSYTSAPSALPIGTDITPGASNVVGTAVAIIGTALPYSLLSSDIIVSCNTSGSGASGIDSSEIIDLLIDRAGGTSWDTTNLLVEGLPIGFSAVGSSTTSVARKWEFPLLIPAGATVAARSQSAAASPTGTRTVRIIGRGLPNDYSKVWAGQKVEAIGLTRAASKGASVTPGSGFSSFSSVTTAPYGALSVSVSPNNSNMGSNIRRLRVGIGGVQIGPNYYWGETVSEQAGPVGESMLIRQHIPEGTQLQVEITTSTGSSTDQVIMHGVR